MTGIAHDNGLQIRNTSLVEVGLFAGTHCDNHRHQSTAPVAPTIAGEPTDSHNKEEQRFRKLIAKS